MSDKEVRRKGGKVKRIILYLNSILFFTSLTLLCGCRVHMNTEEKIAMINQDKEDTEEQFLPLINVYAEESQDTSEPEGQELLPLSTVYAEESQDTSEAEGQETLQLTTEIEKFAEPTRRITINYKPFSEESAKEILRALYGNEVSSDYNITVADGGTFLFMRCHDEDYRDLMQAMVFFGGTELIDHGDGAVLRRPELEFFSQKEEDEGIVDRAETEARKMLEALGYTIAYMDHTYLSSEVITNLKQFSYQFNSKFYENLEEPKLEQWEEDGIIYFAARQEYDSFLVESYNAESLIRIAYSVKEGRIIYLDTYMPPYVGSPKDIKELTILSREEAFEFAKVNLRDYGYGNHEINKAELAYVHYLYGSYEYEKCELELWPAWKLSYTMSVGGDLVTDYIMIDAETGRFLNNGTPLY